MPKCQLWIAAGGVANPRRANSGWNCHQMQAAASHLAISHCPNFRITNESRMCAAACVNECPIPKCALLQATRKTHVIQILVEVVAECESLQATKWVENILVCNENKRPLAVKTKDAISSMTTIQTTRNTNCKSEDANKTLNCSIKCGMRFN